MAAIPVTVSLKFVNSSIKKQIVSFGSAGLTDCKFLFIHLFRVTLYSNGIDRLAAMPVAFFRKEDTILFLTKKLKIEGTAEPILLMVEI